MTYTESSKATSIFKKSTEITKIAQVIQRKSEKKEKRIYETNRKQIAR
jgi:hypothetical protein